MENIKFKNCCNGCKNLIVISREASDRDRNRYTIVECEHMPVCCKYKRANAGLESEFSASSKADMVDTLLRILFSNLNPNA